MMLNRLVFLLFLCLLGRFSTLAQVQDFAPVRRPKMGDKVGPLVLESVEPSNGWIGVAWDPKAPPPLRRIGSETPNAANKNLWLSIQLDYINARSSSDPIENDSFRKQYNEGLKTLLANHRTFWFQVTNTDYAGPGQIGGVFLLDAENGPTIQLDMIRRGYAVTETWEPRRKSPDYRDDYRDRLLRLEGEARTCQIGIWAPRLDPKLLPLDKAVDRLEQAANDPTQAYMVREKVIQQLLRDGDQNKYLDLAITFASDEAKPIKRSEAFRYVTQACKLSKLSETNQKKYLQYVYDLLDQINDGQGNGYFLAMDIGSCIDIKPGKHSMRPFTPDPKLPQYHDELGNLGKNYFQDTVNNALDWWNEHKGQYQ